MRDGASPLNARSRSQGRVIQAGYRLDFLVERSVIVELKVVEKIMPVHEAQLLTYMKVSGMQVGLLINFNESTLVDGVRRRIL